MSESSEKKNTPTNIPASSEVMSVLGIKPTAKAISPEVEAATEEAKSSSDSEIQDEVEDYNASNMLAIGNVLKKALPFIVLLVIAIFVYYFYFSKTDFSFSDIFQSKTEVASISKQKNVDDLFKTEQGRFESYMREFYFDISDASILDPNADLSGNGLTSFQKYILGLNPKVYDTLKNGKADSETLADGINPISGEKLTDDQKKLIDQFIQLDVAVNKKKPYPAEEPLIVINPYSLRGESVDPYATEISLYEPVEISNTQVQVTNGNSSVVSPAPILKRTVVNTTPKTTATKPASQNPASYPNQTAAPKYNKLNIPPVTNYLDIDFNVPGKLEIPSLSLSAPINWPSDPSQNDKALETGVLRLPGTADPGSLGTSYISGHSSGYAFAAGNYKTIFAKLNDIPDKASIYVYVTNKQGKVIKLTYIVHARGEYTPDDPAQFKNYPESTLALGTCWPVGGTAKRKVIFSTLDKIER